MKKKIFMDMLLNILATAIPIVVLQLWLLPSLSRSMSDSQYGLLVTVVSFFNVLPSTAGNVLNNIRLLYTKSEMRKGEEGNYNVLLVVMFFINLIATLTISFIYDKYITFLVVVLNIVTATLFLVHEYYIVAFRLHINYVRVIVSNVFLSIGYIIGYGLYLVSSCWQLVYIMGYLLSVIYIMCKSTLWKEPLQISRGIKRISLDTTWLMLAGILGRVVTYADKLLIFPLLGGGIVAIYHVATVFGKVISLAISPMSSVLLTYLSKEKKKNNSEFLLTLITGTVVCVLGYVICVGCSRPILEYLYPQYTNTAMNYISITTATAVLQAMVSLVTPFVMRFFDMKWQVVVNGGNATIYVVLCIILLNQWGLYGFCVGALLACIAKLCLLIVVYFRCHTREECKE